MGGQSNVTTSDSVPITIGVIGGVDSSTVQTNVGSASTVTVTDSLGKQIPITASADGGGISVNLGCNLYPSTTYTISVSGVKTQGGQPVSGSTTFTTANSYQGTSCEDPVLSWTAPTKNTDGSDLTNLAGYKIYYMSGTCNDASHPIVLNASGGAPGSPAPTAQTAEIASPSTLTYTVNQQFAAGNARFVIEAYNSNGQYSVPSNEACKSMP